jgi:YebC/PmpR family DNA-binding regulatory protein
MHILLGEDVSMSGHSKWHNIRLKKEKTDGQRAQIFTKLSREITVAVKEGGPDPSSNSKLKDIISKAKAANVPNDNIYRVIDKAAGSSDNSNFESITYEGYGPEGVAVIVETLTDNRNRTVSEVRHYFDKYGGNLGATGCVSWNFKRMGVIVIDSEDLDEDAVMLEALDAGASDFKTEDEVFEIYTEPENFGSVLEQLQKLNYTFVSAQIEQVPQTYVKIEDEAKAAALQKLLDKLEEFDDVQNVWHNWEE